MGNPGRRASLACSKHCPLPTPEDRLFFLLTYLKTSTLQVVQGRLFGMRQSKAHQWMHVLVWSKYSNLLFHWKLRLYHRPGFGLSSAPSLSILSIPMDGTG